MEIAPFLAWRFGAGSPPPEEARLLALLDDIARHGSIAAAARRQGLSYRHAWGLIEKWQSVFGRPLLAATRGSGSEPSAFARRLLELDRRLAAQLAPRLQAAGEEMRRLLAEEEQPRAVRLALAASHDLALVKLQELMQADGHAVDLQFRGSVESLELLARGACDAAGFHCPEGDLGRRIWTEYRKHLRPRKHVLLPLGRRVQGLMVQPGNPRKLRSVADLARRNVRFLNRQPGAGTRLLLDLLLARQGIDVHRIRGYASEEHTHAAVAALVAGGEADVALGIEAAARRFGLDFVPLVPEDYFLALPRSRLQEAPLAALRAYVAGAAFGAALGSLPGYAPLPTELSPVGAAPPGFGRARLRSR
ncbi:MAG: substrate-binding domain-containing protein [Pseudomonadota bacterium]